MSYNKPGGSNSAALGLLGVARLTQKILYPTTFTQRLSTWLTSSLQLRRLTAYLYLCYKIANADQTALLFFPTYVNKPARLPNRRRLSGHCAAVAGKINFILHLLRQQSNFNLTKGTVSFFRFSFPSLRAVMRPPWPWDVAPTSSGA